MKNIINKRGQITIFVIISFMIVAGIILFFIFTGGKGISKSAGISEKNPSAFMQLCIENDLKNNIKIIEEQGGFMNPLDFQMYDNKKVAYLCKTNMNYEPCINQHPVFLSEINKEISNSIEESVEDCFEELKQEYEKKAMEVEINGDTEINAEVVLNKILIRINKNIKIIKSEEVSTYEQLNLEIASRIYELIHIASRIVNNEAKYCYFERTGYMNLHPEYEILMTAMSDGTKIYSIEDLKSQEKMNIAIKGCTV